jgi:hypothetical protein
MLFKAMLCYVAKDEKFALIDKGMECLYFKAIALPFRNFVAGTTGAVPWLCWC